MLCLDDVMIWSEFNVVVSLILSDELKLMKF